MHTLAMTMMRSASAFRLALFACIFTVGIYAAAVYTEEAVDFSELLAYLHARTEAQEFDELLVGVLFIGVALMFDLYRNLKNTRKTLEVERSSLEISHSALMAKTAELERANAALREAQTRLIDMERLNAVREVVISLHHEVLNPLTGVLGAIELLREKGAVAPHRADALVCAEHAARKIEALVKRLPELRQIERVPYMGDVHMIDLKSGTPDN